MTESVQEAEELTTPPSSCSLSSDKPMDLKQGVQESILKRFVLVTAKPKEEREQRTTTLVPMVNGTSDQRFLWFSGGKFGH